MKLLKIRDQFINIDLLESVTIDDHAITISIAGNKYFFTGDEAVLLMRWFNRYAFDLMKHREIAMTKVTRERPPVKPAHTKVRALGLFRKPFVLQ